MNLVLLLGQLGLSWDVQGETVFPIGTLYDPFVMRALEGIVYSVYSGSRFILAGTPSGISLSREGGAHQSINTPGIGIETPSLTYAEPCYAREFEWLLLDALERMQEPKGGGTYLRLSTTPIEQGPFAAFVARVGEERGAGGCGGGRLPAARAGGPADDRVILAGCGAIMPEVLRAADQLSEDEGIEATVLCLSSPDLLYRGWRAARVRPLRGEPAGSSHLDSLVTPDERGAAGRDRDRRREPRARLARECARHAMRAARGGRVRPDREPGASFTPSTGSTRTRLRQRLL